MRNICNIQKDYFLSHKYPRHKNDVSEATCFSSGEVGRWITRKSPRISVTQIGLQQRRRTCGTSAQNGTRHLQLFYIYISRPLSPYCAEHVYIHTYSVWLRTDCIWITVGTEWLQWNVFTQIGPVRSFDWGAGLALTGPIRDIGRNVLQSAFEQAAAVTAMFCSYRVHWGGFITNIMINTVHLIMGSDSSVGIATRYWLDGPGIEFR